MTSRQLIECLTDQRPYLGPALRALQGVPKRHAYLQAVVELLSKGNHVQAIKILEVGSWAGGSAITWAKAVQKYFGDGEVVCVDQWAPYFNTGINPEPVYSKMNQAAADGSIYRLFLHNIKTSGVGNIVSTIIGNSQNVLPTLQENDFWIVYLDGSHRFPDVLADIQLSVDLVKMGGIICGDDLELQRSGVGLGELIRDVGSEKDYVKSEKCGVFYHPGVTRAVAEIFGEVSAWEGFWAMRKTKDGWAKVDLSGCKIEVPEHISNAEDYPPAVSDDRKRLILPIHEIAEQLTEEAIELSQQVQGVPRVLGSYCGFNIVRVNDYYYGVRQSLGEIDWSVTYSELLKSYGGANLFRCKDRNAIIQRIALDELLVHIENLSLVLATTLLRHEALVDRLSDNPPNDGKRPTILEQDYRGFNLIAYGGGVWAAAMAAGPIDFQDTELLQKLVTEGQLFEAMTLDGARGAVDRCKFNEMLAEQSKKIQTLEEELQLMKSTITYRMLQWYRRVRSRTRKNFS